MFLIDFVGVIVIVSSIGGLAWLGFRTFISQRFRGAAAPAARTINPPVGLSSLAEMIITTMQESPKDWVKESSYQFQKTGVFSTFPDGERHAPSGVVIKIDHRREREYLVRLASDNYPYPVFTQPDQNAIGIAYQAMDDRKASNEARKRRKAAEDAMSAVVNVDG